jgi:phage terminase large subunit
MPIAQLHQVVFRAHRKQLRFLRSRARLVALLGGAGSGKTTAGVIWSLMHAAHWPGSRGMLIARSYPQLKQSLLVELERWARESRLDELWRFNRQDMEIRLPNGSRFWLRSADRPESLLGADLAWLYGDEVALWEEAAFKYALSRLRQPGFPHQAAFTFTPKGRNWAYQVFGQPRPDLEIIRCATRENPYLDPGFVAMLEAHYGATPFARQELEGEFVSCEGLVYPQFAPQVHVQPAPPPSAFKAVVAGVDWGYTNPGAIVVVGWLPARAGAVQPWAAHLAPQPPLSTSPETARPAGAAPGHPGDLSLPAGACGAASPGRSPSPPADPRSPRPPSLAPAAGIFWAVAEVYARSIPPVGPAECWLSIARALQAQWGIEAFYCDPSEPANLAAFVREGLPAAAGDNSVEPGIARIAALLAAERLFIAPQCRNLIEEFGRYSYETDRDGQPTGRVLKAYDHALDALRYAIVGLQSRRPPRIFIQSA